MMNLLVELDFESYTISDTSRVCHLFGNLREYIHIISIKFECFVTNYNS